MPDAPKVAPFHEASAACQRELLEVLRRYADRLGGPLGEFDVLTELLGTAGVAIVHVTPIARPRIEQRLLELALYITAAATTPQ